MKQTLRLVTLGLGVFWVTGCTPNRTPSEQSTKTTFRNQVRFEGVLLGQPNSGDGNRAHYGADFAGEVGDDVYAMYDGMVTKLGGSRDLGPHMVRITSMINGKKWFVDYGRLSSYRVALGDTIKAGVRIGAMGRERTVSLCPTHVHIQIWRYLHGGVRGFHEPRWNK